MPKHFEDALGDWRRKADPDLREAHERLLAQLLAALPLRDGTAPSPEEMSAAARVVLHRATESFADKLSEAALEHIARLREMDALPERDRLRSEIAAAFRVTASPVEVGFPPPILRTKTVMWALPAALGAFIGILVLPPIALISWGNRDLGYIVGGPIGAGLLTLLAALLSEHPRVRLAVQVGLGLAAVRELVGVFSPWRRMWASLGVGQRTVWQRVERVLLWMGAIFALHVTRARPTLRREDVEVAVRSYLELLLRSHLDLIFAIAWSHPDVQPASTPSSRGQAMVNVEGLFVALAKMHLISKVGGATEELLVAAREVVQSLRTVGVEVVEHPAGTQFDPAMKDIFDLLEPIETGGPIRTLKPAVVKEGQVLIRGRLEALRGGN